MGGAQERDTVRDILDICADDHGSFGTGNCESCHVTKAFEYKKLAAVAKVPAQAPARAKAK